MLLLLAVVALAAGGLGVAGLGLRATANTSITATGQYLVNTATFKVAGNPSATTLPALNEEQAPANWQLTVDGSGFTPGQVATLTLGSNSTTTPVDGSGGFTVTLTLTTFPCGIGTVSASDEDANTGQASVDLVCAQVHPIVNGTSVTFRGLGYPVPGDPTFPNASGYDAWITAQGVAPAGAPDSTGSVGTFGDFSFATTVACAPTPYTVTAKTAYGTESGDPTSTADFTVACAGSITLPGQYDGTSGPQLNLDDNPYTVQGSGFLANGAIQLKLNGANVGAPITPAADGSFSATLDASSALNPCNNDGSAAPDGFIVSASQAGGDTASDVVNDVRCDALGARSDAYFGVGGNGAPNPYGFIAFHPGTPYTFEITPLAMRVNVPVTAMMDNTSIGASTSDGQGDADFTATWQQPACGPHTLNVAQPAASGGGSVTASIPFYVTCLAADTQQVTPGQSVHLSGTNYEADTPIDIYLDNKQDVIGNALTPDASDPAQPTGDFTADVTLPDSLSCGSHTIFAVEDAYHEGPITPGLDYDPLGPHGTVTVVACPPPPSPSPSPSPSAPLTPSPTPTPTTKPSPTPSPTVTPRPSPAPTPAPPGPTPDLSVDPGVAQTGALVTATGRHFAPHARVTLIWRMPVGGGVASVRFETKTDAQGHFRVVVPAGTDGITGPLVLHATDMRHRHAAANLLVEPGGWEPAGFDPTSLLPILFPKG